MIRKNIIIALLLFPIFVSGQAHWESLILAGDTWKYLPATSEPPADWMMPGFDDGLWPEGPGGIGYDDGDDVTTLTTKVNSLYLRRTFQVPSDTLIRRLLLDIDYDDAFVAYLNGQPFARSFNVIDEFPAYNGALTVDREAVMFSGGAPERYVVDTSLLQTGENVLAVHILNFNINSSDLSSIIFLHGEITAAGQYYSVTPAWFIAPINMDSSKLPIISINTNGQIIPDDPRIVATMGVIDNGPGQMNSPDDPFNNYDGRITIETRGQSSQMFPKKSYRLETQDSLGENLNVSLLGMPIENDWILYAPYSDKSMLRNAITFELAGELDTYCSRIAYCDLYINNDYQGVYILMEQIKRDDNRVNIARLEPTENSGDDLTGGYIFKVDKVDPDYVDGFDGFTSSPSPSYPNAKEVIYQYYDPGSDELTPIQRNYLKESIIAAEAVLISNYFDDPDIGYNQFLNTGSFVDFMLINEISKEVDKYRYSNYFYKKQDSKGGEIFAGPIWDFNLGYGNVDYWPEGLLTSNWLYDDLQPFSWSIMFWWARLNDDPWFRDLVNTRWEYLRQGTFSNENIQARIDSITGYIGESVDLNYEKWPILGTYVWPNHDWADNTYSDEVAYFSDWLFARLSWLDNNFSGNILDPSVTISPAGRQGDYYLFQVQLSEDYFNNKSLRKKYFDLTSDQPLMFIDTVYYDNASTATLALAYPSAGITGDARFSVTIDERILNGFRPLQTTEMLVGTDPEIAIDPFDIELYAAGKSIILKTSQFDMLPDHLEVFNTAGKLLGFYSIDRSYFNEINTDLQPGVYLVTLKTGERRVYKKVLIR